jgi:CPA1 family monovalent cation:H+ antiporter
VSGFGTAEELQLLGLLAGVAVLLVLAPTLRIPYPILLVLGGVALGFVPGLPTLTMAPDLVLIGVLPPLLYSAAFFTGLRELRTNAKTISLLSLGLVTATTAGVAVVAHRVVGLSWPSAFVLGAVVSPTDPLAATAVGARLGVPRRLTSIVEGESLVNDGTALVLYRVAIVAAVSGSFTLWKAGGLLVLNIVGGVAVGLAVGVVIRELRRRLDNPPLEIMIAFLTGYFAFLPASALHVSGVLAVVTAGVFMGWHTPELTTAQTRIQGRAFWEIINFLLNALLFALVGLQLRPIVDRLSGAPWSSLIGDAAMVSITVIAARIMWSLVFTYLPGALRGGDRRKRGQFAAFIAWAGMRGAVTLAAALAVPLRTDSGAPFPDRDRIIFLSFAVVVATLVGQGLTLPLVIRGLGLEADGRESKEEAKARIRASEAALTRLEELLDEDWVNPETADRVRGQYQFRRSRFSARFDAEDDGAIEERSQAYQRLRRELLDAEHRAVLELRNAGVIGEDVMHQVQRDLDLEDLRLDA